MDVPKIVTQLSLEHLSIFLYCIIHGIIKFKHKQYTIHPNSKKEEKPTFNFSSFYVYL